MDQICMLGLHVDKFKHIVKFVCNSSDWWFWQVQWRLKEQAILALSGGSWCLRPFLPALPTPLCDCGLSAFVSQSRHPDSARRAFYVCQLKRPPRLDSYLNGCNFFRWIDGHEMFDPLIRLFPYDPWKSWPYDGNDRGREGLCSFVPTTQSSSLPLWSVSDSNSS
jgi:hypothetical protein